MPKVTEAHRGQRRDQILAAAWVSFSRDGFHNTSMASLIKESGLSAGAVYSYFRSKEELIFAVAEQVLGRVAARLDNLAEGGEIASPTLIATTLIQQATGRSEPRAPTAPTLFPLLLGVFSEATRNPEIGERCRQIIGVLRQKAAMLLQRWQDAGNPLPAPPEQLAPVLIGVVQGLILQRALTASPEVDDYLTAVTALLAAAGLA